MGPSPVSCWPPFQRSLPTCLRSCADRERLAIFAAFAKTEQPVGFACSVNSTEPLHE